MSLFVLHFSGIVSLRRVFLTDLKRRRNTPGTVRPHQAPGYRITAAEGSHPKSAKHRANRLLQPLQSCSPLALDDRRECRFLFFLVIDVPIVLLFQ